MMNRLFALAFALGLAWIMPGCATDDSASSQPTAEELAAELEADAPTDTEEAEADASAAETASASGSGESVPASTPQEEETPPIPRVSFPRTALEGRRLTATAAEILNDPAFREQFANSYVAETEIEPGVTTVEREALLPILDLIAGEQLEAAAELIRPSLGPDSSAVFDFLLANVRLQQDRPAEAAAAYKSAVGKHKKFRRAWQGLAQINFREGNFDQALLCFTKVIELGGGDALTYGIIGICHSRLGNNLAAESAFRQANLRDPDSIDWELGMAESFLKQGRFQEAIALFDKLIARDGSRPEFWLAQGEAYARTKQTARAAENFEIVDRLGGSTFESLINLGNIYANDNIFDLAVTAFVRAMRLAPEKGAGNAIQAAKYMSGRGALDETAALVAAIEEIHGTTLETSDRTDLLHLRARIAVARGATDEQAEVLTKIIELDPLDGEALMLLGQHEFAQANKPDASEEVKRNRRLQAIFYFERAAAIDRFEANAKVRQASVYAAMKEYDKALPLLERAQALQPRENVQKFLDDVKRRSSAKR